MADDRSRRWVSGMADAYDRWLAAPVFRPYADELAARVARREPRRILEVAAGTGALTVALSNAVPSAELVATDFSDAMAGVGRTRAPRASWRTADAMALPFADGEFDVVTCQFGVMFFPDKRVAFGEARRVLSSRGAFVFNTWASLDSHEFHHAIVVAAERVYPDGSFRYMRDLPHAYADVAVVSDDLSAAGFVVDRAESVPLEAQAPSAGDIARGYLLGTPMRLEVEACDELAAGVERIVAAFEAIVGRGEVTAAMNANVYEATAPA